MYHKPIYNCHYNINMESITDENTRYINTDDINVPAGYMIEVFAQGLNTPSGMIFTQSGDILIADSGYITGNAIIYRYSEGNLEVYAEGFEVPMLGITEYDNEIYVAHRGKITVLRQNGNREDILSGLPSYGDYSNSKIAVGPDHKIYFGQGTATNSGVVGVDNQWIVDYPFFYDRPGSYVILNGQNFRTNNIMTLNQNDITYTGAFSPYRQSNLPFETRKGTILASGSILRVNLDGTELELVCWGLRSPSYLRFDETGRLFSTNNGYDIRGSRPIANAPDEFHYIQPGIWYGWPDYSGGEPVTSSRFRPEGSNQLQFLLTNHPNLPPSPYALFPSESTIIGFDFNYNTAFGPYGDVYIAEFGSIRPYTITGSIPAFVGSGHRISRIDMSTGGVYTFAINKSGFPAYLSGEGGLGRPSDVVFGPDGAMYIVDMGSNYINNSNVFIPNSGVIWRISKT